MKKKTAPKKTVVRKTVKRTIPRSTSLNLEPSLFVRRIVIISACLVLVVIGVVGLNRSSVTGVVAGAQIMNGLFDQATIALPSVPNAAAYNIYYKQEGAATFTNAVRDVPPNIQQYTLSYLKKGVKYEYQVAALDTHDKEFYFSSIESLTNLQSM